MGAGEWRLQRAVGVLGAVRELIKLPQKKLTLLIRRGAPLEFALEGFEEDNLVG